MRRFCAGVTTAMLALCAVGASAGTTISGDYVEARTCNVYTGACHANGEAVTTGREAILAWNIKSGKADGVNLAGLNAVAVVTADDNLAKSAAQHRTVLYVDSRASDAQRAALASALVARYGSTFGQIVAVNAAPISFAKDGLDYTVRIPGAAYVKTTRFACSHCVMPHAVWYEPFVPLKSSIVASAAVNEFKGDAKMPQSWRSVDENSSFVGEFAF